MKLLDKAIEITKQYKERLEREDSKNKGQFFTTSKTAEYMASRFTFNSERITILDIGAGTGILTAATIEQAINSNVKSIYVTVVENDEKVLKTLNKVLAECNYYCLSRKVGLIVRIQNENYILSDNNKKYDYVISNPPYRKIRKDSEEAQKMIDYVTGQPNIYGLIMVKGLKQLKEGGQYCYLTPRSWTNGLYFKRVREDICNTNIKEVMIFRSRSKVFSNVLQETMMVSGIKDSNKDSGIKIDAYNDSDFEEKTEFELKKDEIITKSGKILIPETEAELRAINELRGRKSLIENGYQFKTGPVMEFRHTDILSKYGGRNYIPFIRVTNIVKGEFKFPVKNGKPQYIREFSRFTMKNEPTVLVRGIAAKTDPKLIQSCAYTGSLNIDSYSISTGVRYLVRVDGKELSVKEVDEFNNRLQRQEYENYLRAIQGSTEINCSDLNEMPW